MTGTSNLPWESMTYFSMSNQVSSHDGDNNDRKDSDESKDGSGIDIYPASPVFKTPLVGMKRDVTEEKLRELNLDDLFPKEHPDRKEEDKIIAPTDEFVWLSPFHNSCLSPILSKKKGLSKEIPESLEPLLSKEDASWTSSLATPRAHNLSCSHVNSVDKQTASADNFDFLFSCDDNRSATYKKPDITTDIVELSLPRHVKETPKEVVQPSANKVFSKASLKCVDQSCVIDGSLSKQKKCRTGFQCKDGTLAINQVKRADKRNFQNEGDKSVTARRLFDVPDTNKVTKSSVNDVQVEYLDARCVIPDKVLHVKSTSDYVGGKKDASKVSCDIQSDSQKSLSANYYSTQEFFSNLSFGTLDEVFQATEMLGSAENSPGTNPPVDNRVKMVPAEGSCIRKGTPELSKAPNKEIMLNRTSTPLSSLNKRLTSCKEINRKKIKFVADVEKVSSRFDTLDFQDVESKESDSKIFSQELSKVASQEQASKEIRESALNLTPASKIEAIKKIASTSKSFIYAQSSNAKKSTSARNSVLNLADLLREAQILEDGEAASIKASVLLSSEKKKRLENSCYDCSDSNFVSFSRLCKLDDSNDFEVSDLETKKHLAHGSVDVNLRAAECESNVCKSGKAQIFDSSCEMSDKFDPQSPILVSSHGKRLRPEDCDFLDEFDIIQEHRGIQDHSAKRKCYSGTAIHCLKSSGEEVLRKTHVNGDKFKTCDSVKVVNSFGGRKLSDIAGEELATGDLTFMLDTAQHIPRQDMENVLVKLESNLLDTDNISIMDITDTQLITAGETRNVILQLTKNGTCGQRQNGVMIEDVPYKTENKSPIIGENNEQVHAEAGDMREEMAGVRKVKSYGVEDIKKNDSIENSCTENYENLLDSDTVDQLFEQSPHFIHKSNWCESEKNLPFKNDDPKSINGDDISKHIVEGNSASINTQENILEENSELNSKGTGVIKNKALASSVIFDSANSTFPIENTSNKMPEHCFAVTNEAEITCKKVGTSARKFSMSEPLSCPTSLQPDFKRENNECTHVMEPEVSKDGSFGDTEGTAREKTITKNMFSGKRDSKRHFRNSESTQNYNISETEKQAGQFISGNNNFELKINYGFSTASGKKLSVSEAAFKKSVSLFLEDDSCEPMPKIYKVATSSERKRVAPESEIVDQENSKVVNNCMNTKQKVLNRALKNEKFLVSWESVSTEESSTCLLSTASGKKVDVSKEALRKVQKLFSEERMLDVCSGERANVSVQAVIKEQSPSARRNISDTSVDNHGLFTSNGKNRSISKLTLKTAKPRLSEADVVEQGSANCGFTTASGKKLKVSKQALKAAKKLLEENTLEPAAQNVGFCTASGKKVDVSEQAKSDFCEQVLKNVKSLCLEGSVSETRSENLGVSEAIEKKWEDSEQAVEVKNFFSEGSTLETDPKNWELCTVTGKRVSVSEQPIDKVKYLFPEVINLETGLKNCGFSTASGKKVHVSDEAMRKAKSLLSEENVLERKLECYGFSTASGKKVNVSEQALKKAKTLFSEESMSEISLENDGFSTASGKKVNVSEQAMKEALSFCPGEGMSEMKLENDVFSAASGKKVNVCEKAMKNVNSLFSGESMFERKSEHYGFSTASGKKVNVSKQAMEKAKSLFSEESVSLMRSDNCGFSTASGKKVNVSEQAMKKAKALFSEECVSESRAKNCAVSTACGNKDSASETSMGKAKLLSLERSVLPARAKAKGEKTNVSKQITQKKKSSVMEDSSLKQLVANFGSSSFTSEAIGVTKEVLKNSSQFPHSTHNEELSSVSGAGDLKNADNITKPSASLDDVKYYLHDNQNELCKIDVSEDADSSQTSLECQQSTKQNNFHSAGTCENSPRIDFISAVSSAVFCDAASIHDFLLGTEAMQSHSQNSDSSCKFYVDNNVLKSPVLQRNCMPRKGEPQGTYIDFDSPSSPILRSKNFVDPKKIQSSYMVPKDNINNCVFSTIEKGLDSWKSNCRNSKNPCEVTKFVSEVSLSQEMDEQMAALLMDESTAPFWASSYVTSPDSTGDRFDAPKPVVSSDAGDVIPQLKFALGRNDRFHSKQPRMSLKYKAKLSITSSKVHSPVGTSKFSEPSGEPSTAKKTSFKVPYKDTGLAVCVRTPSAIQPLRSTRKKLAFETPFRTGSTVSMTSHETEVLATSDTSSADVAAARSEAAREQESQIKRAERRGDVRRCKGSHLLRKVRMRGEQSSWEEAAAGRLPGAYTRDQLLQLGIKEDVISVAAANAAEYRFSAWDFYSREVCENNTTGIAVGDGAMLVLDAAGFVGVEEVARAFLSSPGVDPSLLPSDKWVANHYRWIVWKLAATDRSFPTLFSSRCLSPNNVMLQLKYRYDREIDRNERPALSRILQRDDAAAKRVILCVANISKAEGNLRRDIGPYELELSDGWYSMMASVDHEMCRLIESKVVTVGTKLVTHGAELLNCDQGCMPLEVGSGVRLRLHTNSTRRARWYARLGYHSCPGPLPVRLSSVLPLGGLVSCVTVVVARLYPPVYVQKVTDGKSVIRNERMEERAAMQFERSRQETAERVLSQVQAQLKQESSRLCKPGSARHKAGRTTSQMSGEDLCLLLESASDPASLQVSFSAEQRKAVMMYQEKHCEEMRREVESRMREQLQHITRDVVPLLKVRCTDAIDVESEKYATLSIWRASEDVASLLKEGAVIKLFSVTATGNRYRGTELQLSASKQTVYQPIPRRVVFPQRRATPLQRIAGKDFCPPFREVDVVGVVVCVESGTAGCDEVYLASEEFAFLCVVFKGGVQEFGFEDILVPENKVAASNLQWRPDTSPGHLPRVYAWECSSFCLHPRNRHLQETLKILEQKMTRDMKHFLSVCKEKMGSLRQQKAQGMQPREQTAASVSEATAQATRIEASKAAEDVRPPSAAERRIMKLELYGEPPPLSPLVLPRPQATLRRAFRAPQRVNVPCGQNPQAADSPPLSLESHSEDE